MRSQPVYRQHLVSGTIVRRRRSAQDHELRRDEAARVELLAVFDRHPAQSGSGGFGYVGCLAQDDHTQRQRVLVPPGRGAEVDLVRLRLAG